MEGVGAGAVAASEPVDTSFCFIILLLLHFYIIGATFLLFWAQLMVQKVNWRDQAQSSCSCRLPTTQKEEVADRAKSFGSVPVAVGAATVAAAAAAASFPHKICLIKIFVKISKLFCCVGSLEMSSNSVFALGLQLSFYSIPTPHSPSCSANSWRNKILPPTMKLLNN